MNAPFEIRNIVTGESYFYDIGLSPNDYNVSMVLAWSPTSPNRIAVAIYSSANHSSWTWIYTMVDTELQFEYVLDGYYYTSRLDWNADGTRIATIGSNQCCALNKDGIQIWDAATGAMVAERVTDSPYTSEVDWHPNNPDLLVFTTVEHGLGRAIFQWDVSTDIIVWTTGYKDGTLKVAWNPAGTIIAGLDTSLYGDLEVHFYDGITGERNTTFDQRWGYYPSEIMWLNEDYILIDIGILEIRSVKTQLLVYQIEDSRSIIAWHPISGFTYANRENHVVILAPDDIFGNS
jgi:hypothetical protein